MPIFGRRYSQNRIKRRVFWSLFAIVCALGAAWLIKPLVNIRQQSTSLAQLRAQEAAMLDRQQELARYRHFLATSAGRENAVRRAGYVKPGERRLVFIPEQDKAKTQVPKDAKPAS